jgi:cytochrome c peroxidase
MRLIPECAWGANAGLETTRKFLEPVAAKFGLSQADVWTLAGVTAIEYMGGPNVNWKPGRTDSPKPTNVPDGRLPSANCGSSNNNIAHIRAIFGRMGFDDRETVALIGAHAVGRCHTDASGFWGPWTYAEATFSNEVLPFYLEATVDNDCVTQYTVYYSTSACCWRKSGQKKKRTRASHGQARYNTRALTAP